MVKYNKYRRTHSRKENKKRKKTKKMRKINMMMKVSCNLKQEDGERVREGTSSFN